MSKNDELFFADELSDHCGKENAPWKIMIADDEEEVHAVTRMIFQNFTFEGRDVQLLSTYSGKETKAQLIEHPDTAVLLLDVVMEDDKTGLEVVRYIRDELHNTFVRIILRTGQPGQAPEKKVTLEYDINDYKEKTELTSQKLFTIVIGLLRSYRDLRLIERNRKGLEHIAGISARLFEQQTLPTFLLSLLVHVSAILHLNDKVSNSQSSGFAISRQAEHFSLLAGIGDFKAYEGCAAEHALSSQLYQQLMNTVEAKCSQTFPDAYWGYFTTTSGAEHLIYLQKSSDLTDIDKELLHVLEMNARVAFENIELYQGILETQREVIFTLGKVVETRSLETRDHIHDVAKYSYLLAQKAGMPEEDADMLRLASPLHDVGTLGIPDAILHKKNSLTKQEIAVFHNHPHIGYAILRGSKQPVLKMAAQIALQHHEHWNGRGFPQKLQGENIHLFARILRIADTLQGLLREVTFPISDDASASLKQDIQKRRGTEFDPRLTDILLTNLDEFLQTEDTYSSS